MVSSKHRFASPRRSLGQARALGAAALLGLAGLAACSDTPQPQAKPEGSATPQNSETSIKRDKMPALAPSAKIDPLVMKAYRAESCFYGTLSLKQARAAYLASLGGAAPGPGKIPAFGVDLSPDTRPTKAGDAPAASGSAAAAAAPSSAPVASAAAAASGAPAMAGRPDIGGKARVRSVPYERFARSCTVAAGLKNPAAPELDKAMAEFAPFAVQLSKDLAMANTYYQKAEHEKDDFAKGKEYHQKLTEAFGKLDEHHKKLADALAAWSTANPLDESGYTEAQKLGLPAIVEARAAILALDSGDKDALATRITKLDEASAALKKWGEDNKDKNDPGRASSRLRSTTSPASCVGSATISRRPRPIRSSRRSPCIPACSSRTTARSHAASRRRAASATRACSVRRCRQVTRSDHLALSDSVALCGRRTKPWSPRDRGFAATAAGVLDVVRESAVQRRPGSRADQLRCDRDVERSRVGRVPRTGARRSTNPSAWSSPCAASRRNVRDRCGTSRPPTRSCW
jgi:hypothetical protein